MRSARVAFPNCTACILCSRVRCRVGLMPDTSVSLTRCGGLSACQAPVPRGQVVHSAWRRLGSSEDAPPSPSSATASSACRGSASHVSPESLYVTQLVRHGCVTVVNKTHSFSAPTRASHSVSETANRGHHHFHRRRTVTMHDHIQILG